MDAIYFQTSIPQIQSLAQTFQLNQMTFTFCISSSSGNTILLQTFKLLYETCEQPFASSAVNKNNTNTKIERIIFHFNFLQAKKKLWFRLKIVNSIEQCKILKWNSRFGKKLQLLVVISKVKTYSCYYGWKIKIYLTKKSAVGDGQFFKTTHYKDNIIIRTLLLI